MNRLFLNRLTVIDASLLHASRGLLGESWQVDIELEGSLDHQGMVLDFAQVKRQVKQTLDNHFDHRLLVPQLYPGCHVDHSGHQCEIRFRMKSGEEILHRGPDESVTLIRSTEIKTDALEHAIIENIRPNLPDNVRHIRLHLHPEKIRGARYQYSHGLKHHSGNCQRIAHGHRSRIHIFRNGTRVKELEQEWAERWRDIYLGTRSDLRDRFEMGGTHYYRFSYTADQGSFELVLPKAHCYLIDDDSTVENLARHIALSLKRLHPDSHFRVRAFEGVDKGAIGEA